MKFKKQAKILFKKYNIICIHHSAKMPMKGVFIAVRDKYSY